MMPHGFAHRWSPLFAAILVVVGLTTMGCGRNEAFPDGSTSSADASGAASSASGTASAASAAPIASHAPARVEAANLTEEEATVDGLAMAQISCRSEAKLSGDDSILAALAKQRTELEACVTEPRTLRVHFAFDQGKTGDLRVKDAPNEATARCIAAAVKAASFPKSGACVLTLKLGS